MPLPAHHRSCVVLIALCVALGSGCATGRLRRQATLDLQRADALIALGCYACLLEALAAYERLRPVDPPMRSLRTRRIVHVSLLLALREKELGLPATPHLDRARAAMAPLPASDPMHERLALVTLMPSDPSALRPEAADDERRRLLEERVRVAARLTRPRTASDASELDAYIDLALGCAARLSARKEFDPEAAIAHVPRTPLLAYRLAACGGDRVAQLQALVAEDSRFADVYVWIGRAMLAGGPSAAGPMPRVRAAVEAFTRAREAFPSSPSITMELANVTATFSYREALPLYERVLALVPGHQEAVYCVGLCQSYLRRHREAVATFTNLMASGRWRIGDALYWRAWNRHQLRELDAAWTDVEESKKTLYSSDVYTLAGIIAYDRQELDVARPNLEKGLELQARNCAAAWYLGLVHAGQERWPAVGASFVTASGCYRADADDARTNLARAEASDVPPSVKAEQIAAAKAAIEDSVRQEALSAYNAAFGLVRANHASEALPWLDVARRHDEVKTRADELLGFVNRK